MEILHSSLMGGVWESLIGVTGRILDAILLDNRSRKWLTRSWWPFLQKPVQLWILGHWFWCPQTLTTLSCLPHVHFWHRNSKALLNLSWTWMCATCIRRSGNLCKLWQRDFGTIGVNITYSLGSHEGSGCIKGRYCITERWDTTSKSLAPWTCELCVPWRGWSGAKARTEGVCRWCASHLYSTQYSSCCIGNDLNLNVSQNLTVYHAMCMF